MVPTCNLGWQAKLTLQGFDAWEFQHKHSFKITIIQDSALSMYSMCRENTKTWCYGR